MGPKDGDPTGVGASERAMVCAQLFFLGGMSFNNAGLGYVHSMAQQTPCGKLYTAPSW